MATQSVEITNGGHYFDVNPDGTSGSYGANNGDFRLTDWSFGPNSGVDASNSVFGVSGGFGPYGDFIDIGQATAHVDETTILNPDSDIPVTTLHFGDSGSTNGSTFFPDGGQDSLSTDGNVHLNALAIPLPTPAGNPQNYLYTVSIFGSYNTGDTTTDSGGNVINSNSSHTMISFIDTLPSTDPNALVGGAENFSATGIADPQFMATPYGTEQAITSSGLLSGFGAHLFESVTGTVPPFTPPPVGGLG